LLRKALLGLSVSGTFHTRHKHVKNTARNGKEEETNKRRRYNTRVCTFLFVPIYRL
jgi:hypothetical protein